MKRLMTIVLFVTGLTGLGAAASSNGGDSPCASGREACPDSCCERCDDCCGGGCGCCGSACSVTASER